MLPLSSYDSFGAIFALIISTLLWTKKTIFLSWSSHSGIEKPIWFTRHRLNCGIFLLIGSIFLFNLFSVVAHHPLPSAFSYSTKPIANNFKLLNVIELPEVAAKWTVTVDIASNQGEVSSIQKLTVRSFFSFSFPKFQLYICFHYIGYLSVFWLYHGVNKKPTKL